LNCYTKVVLISITPAYSTYWYERGNPSILLKSHLLLNSVGYWWCYCYIWNHLLYGLRALFHVNNTNIMFLEQNYSLSSGWKPSWCILTCGWQTKLPLLPTG